MGEGEGEGFLERGFFKAWHFPQRQTNKRDNFLNPLNLKVTKRSFNLYCIIMKVTFASASLSMFKGSLLVAFF